MKEMMDAGIHDDILKKLNTGVSKHLLDDSLSLLWGNEAFYALFAATEESFFKHYPEFNCCFELVPQYLENLKKVIWQAQSQERPLECDLLIYDINGQDHWLRLTGTIMIQQEVPVIYFMYTLIDDIMLNSQIQSSSLEEHFNDLEWIMSEYTGNVYISDIDSYELLYVNQHACDTLQQLPGQILGRKCYETIQGRSAPCPFCTNSQLLKQKTYDWEFYNPNLKRTFLIKDRLVNWKGHRARIELSNDMYSSEFKLAKKDQEREAILKTIPGGMARIDARDGKTVLWYNGIFLDMIGYTKEQFEKELNNQCSYMHPEDMRRAQMLIRKLKHTGENVVFEVRAYTRAKEERLWTVTLCFISGEDSWDGIPSYYSVGLDMTEERRQMEKLRYKAEKDALTGIYNREAIQSHITKYLIEYPDSMNALFMIDTDNFKQINDTHGHMIGDVVLSEMASGMKKIMRKNDLVGRIGGDEFAIFMEQITSPKEAINKAEELLEMFHHLFENEKRAVKVGCSIGIAIFPHNGNTFEKLYGCADQALYQAKMRGKNGYVLYDHKVSELAQVINDSFIGTSIDSQQVYAEASDNVARYVFRILYQMKNLDEAIDLILEIVGKQFDVSRAYIFENSKDGKYGNNTHEWCNEGISSEKEKLQNICYADLHNYTSIFKSQDIFYCRDIHTLDKSLTKLFFEQGIHSTLQCAIKKDGFLAGFIGFDECTGLRLWSNEEITTLSLIAQILAVFMQLRKS